MTSPFLPALPHPRPSHPWEIPGGVLLSCRSTLQPTPGPSPTLQAVHAARSPAAAWPRLTFPACASPPSPGPSVHLALSCLCAFAPSLPRARITAPLSSPATYSTHRSLRLGPTQGCLPGSAEFPALPPWGPLPWHSPTLLTSPRMRLSLSLGEGARPPSFISEFSILRPASVTE